MNDKYETAADGCQDVATDNPSAITSIRINGRFKSISHYYGCVDSKENSIPKALTDLETKIDEIVDTKQWIK